jgi:hypothetical protein
MTDDFSEKPIPVRSTKPNPERNPALPQVNSIVLYDGPRSRREVVHFPIHSTNTGEFKQHKITFRTLSKQKGVWQTEPSKSFTLESEDEIVAAIRFINAACDGSIPDTSGKSLLLTAPRGLDVTQIAEVVKSLSQEGKAGVLLELLHQATQTPDLLQTLIAQVEANPVAFAEAAASLNLARYRQSYNELLQLIESSGREADFQRLLTQQPWMFGSEYSEIISNRVLVRGSQQDFVLRRTTDGFIEIVEIKTPLDGQPLFRYDESHSSYYSGSALSMVIGQVQNYIDLIDVAAYELKYRDNLDSSKIRAKIIIGRDGDEEQQKAIRRFNGHLHRIEVLTFDQLSRVAARVLDYLQALIPMFPDDDIPF